MGLKLVIITFSICGDILKEITDFFLRQGCFIIICGDVNAFIFVLDIDSCNWVGFHAVVLAAVAALKVGLVVGLVTKQMVFLTAELVLAADATGVIACLVSTAGCEVSPFLAELAAQCVLIVC